VPAATTPARPAGQPAQSEAAPHRRLDPSVIVSMVAGCVIVASLAVVLVVTHPWSPTPATDVAATDASTEDVTTTEAASGAATLSATSAAPAAQSSTAQTSAQVDYYDSLESIYSKLSGYDSRIAACADTFNQSYLSTSMSTRQDASRVAQSLKKDIDDTSVSLQNLAIPSSSPYYADSENLNTLIACLDKRISVICDAWTISLSYADPTGHSDEICAPLKRDNDSSGHNTYKQQFDDLYASAAPTRH
jgi:hypothetical protein